MLKIKTLCGVTLFAGVATAIYKAWTNSYAGFLVRVASTLLVARFCWHVIQPMALKLMHIALLLDWNIVVQMIANPTVIIGLLLLALGALICPLPKGVIK